MLEFGSRLFLRAFLACLSAVLVVFAVLFFSTNTEIERSSFRPTAEVSLPEVIASLSSLYGEPMRCEAFAEYSRCRFDGWSHLWIRGSESVSEITVWTSTSDVRPRLGFSTKRHRLAVTFLLEAINVRSISDQTD